MAVKTTRLVKLYSKYRPQVRGWNNTGYRQVPWLNVSGVWLEEAGFKIGDAIEIAIRSNQLIITNKRGHGDQND